MAQLTSRERKILFSVVAEYIATGGAVGSRTLARKYGLELSAATIRNVLADLEDSGLLLQPHTSAGRVPTEKALRLFIDALTVFDELSVSDHGRLRKRIAGIFSGQRGGRREPLRATGQLLSELSGTAAVVAASAVESRKLTQLRFVPTKPKQLLAVIVFADGTVENRFIELDGTIEESELTRVHNLLATVAHGHSLAALRELFVRHVDEDRLEVDALRQRAFALGRRALGSASRRGEAVVIEGQSRLVEMPEYADVDRLKNIIRALEDREQLVCLLDKTLEAGVVSVYVGRETGELGGGELSLVVAPYGEPDRGAGAVGVLGPTRMDYAKLMPLVEATADAITSAMKKPEE